MRLAARTAAAAAGVVVCGGFLFPPPPFVIIVSLPKNSSVNKKALEMCRAARPGTAIRLKLPHVSMGSSIHFCRRDDALDESCSSKGAGGCVCVCLCGQNVVCEELYDVQDGA